MVDNSLFYRFGTALIIGILVGIERERAANPQKVLFAGVRTFALMGVAGCTAALISDLLHSPWPFVALLLVIGSLTTVAYFVLAQREDFGLTTEVSSLLTVLTGALCYWNYLALAAAIAVMHTLLLSFKVTMHSFAHRIRQEDVYATLKFAVITAIILPVLPNQSFGPPPFNALNPYRIWLMVVLISGISFAGYVLMQLVDTHKGIWLTGLLGGLVSSTAATLSFAERSQRQQALAQSFALAITAAWTIMFLRVLIEVAAVNSALLNHLWLPITAGALASVAYSGYLYLRQPHDNPDAVDVVNPFELGPALKFGLLYGAILLISKTAEHYFNDSGVYVSSILAGLTDVNAITLSMAELSRQPANLSEPVAAQAIILATISNTVAKGAVVFMMGSTGLRKALWPSALLIIVVAFGAMLLS